MTGANTRTNRKLSSVRSPVDHVFRIIKCQFGYRKARYRGLGKSAAQVFTLVGLTDLYQARRALMTSPGRRYAENSTTDAELAFRRREISF